MDRHPLRYNVNLSILFTELELRQRPAAAARAGFDAVEFWWPFATAVPGDSEVDGFVTAVREAGVRLVGLNFFAGDMPAGDRGLLSWPGREQEFRDSVAIAVHIADRLDCRAFNALYGNRLDEQQAEEQDALAVDNLAFAAREADRIGATVLLEPVSGAPNYPLRTAADAVAVLDRVRSGSGVGNLGLLADLYHLAVNGDDIDEVLDAHTERISHVQIADAPGRHEPGTGRLELEKYLNTLAEREYDGYVGLEYKASGDTEDSFTWLPRPARSAHPTDGGQ